MSSNTNVAKKFKERDPMETVRIVKDFFYSHGYTLSERSEDTDVGTHFCRVHLYHNGINILATNGKGMTKEYSLAAGYAELYERFCNQPGFMHNPFFNEACYEKSKELYGYYIDPNEKVMTDDELINSEMFKGFFDSMFRTDEQKRAGVKLVTNSTPVIGVPYYSFLNDDVEYVDQRFLLRTSRTVGLSAGNTPKEAFNQCLSEIFEHYGEAGIFDGSYEKFYRISDRYLSNYPKLFRVMERIREQGNDIYILDLGYNCGYPVLVSVLVNKKMSNIFVNIGSFAVFEIAFERVLTELYQGVHTYSNFPKFMKPCEDGDAAMSEGANCIMQSTMYPESILFNVEDVAEPSDVFIKTSKGCDNDAVYNFYKELCRKNSLSVYYRLTSRCEDMAAISVFVKEFDFYKWRLSPYSHSSNLFIEEEVIKCLNYLNICNALIKGEVENINLDKLKKALSVFNTIDGAYGGTILNGEYLDFYFYRVPILTPLIEAIINKDTCPDPLATSYLGKEVGLLMCYDAYRAYPELKEKMFKLYGSSWDVSRLEDDQYRFEEAIYKPLQERYQFMRGFVNSFPIKIYGRIIE